jgi:hypothetical protein
MALTLHGAAIPSPASRPSMCRKRLMRSKVRRPLAVFSGQSCLGSAVGVSCAAMANPVEHTETSRWGTYDPWPPNAFALRRTRHSKTEHLRRDRRGQGRRAAAGEDVNQEGRRLNRRREPATPDSKKPPLGQRRLLTHTHTHTHTAPTPQG